jgi:hypothetical protein
MRLAKRPARRARKRNSGRLQSAPTAQGDKKPRSFRSGASGGRLIGRRSEVTGDAEAAGEPVADAMPIAGHEDHVRLAPVVDRPEEAVRRRLVRALIHELEVEVQVVDRVPAEVGADQPGRCGGRKRAQGSREDGATDREEVAAAPSTRARQIELVQASTGHELERFPGSRARSRVGS